MRQSGAVASVSEATLGSRMPPHTVQVDLDLVRSAAPRLDLPTPAGEVLTAELSVFENRGAGDVMWSGRLLGADHDSVVLTIADGRLAGWFGEPMGAKYRLGTEADGGGLMRDTFPELAAGLSWCGFDGSDELPVDSVTGLSPLVSTQERSSHQNHDGLKMLVLYTESAARVWDDPQNGWGGTQAALRNAADYLTMVFRNGQLPLEPEFEFAKAPAWLDAAQSDPLVGVLGIYEAFHTSGEITLLRRNADADHVHLFYLDDVLPLRQGGHGGRQAGSSRLGEPMIFAHEVGHALGGHHQPRVVAPPRPQQETMPQWFLYRFAHAWRRDGTGVADGEQGEFGTAIAYPSTEPYYSTVRLRLQGQQIGIAGERENERAFRRSIHDRAAMSVIEETVPAPPTNLEVVRVVGGSVRFTWTDNSANEVGFRVTVIPHRNWDDQRGYNVGANVESLRLRTTEPGAYTANVRSVRREGFAYAGPFEIDYREFATFVIPGAEPRSPTDVAVAVDPARPECRVVTWKERFTAADKDIPGYRDPLSEVQVSRHARLIKRFFVDAGEESLSYCPADNGPYEFRVYARTWGGRSDSTYPDPVPDPGPDPVHSDCAPTSEQIIFAHGYEVRACFEHEQDGDAVKSDAFDYGLESEESGLLYFFGRDNAEILIKVLDACAENGHRWVFVAPVTDLALNLEVHEVATGKRWRYRNPGGKTADTRSDTAAFPCDAAAASWAASSGVARDWSGEPSRAGLVESGPVSRTAGVLAGAETDCTPEGPVLTLKDGYGVSMCYETAEGETGQAVDWELDSQQSGLLYFFDRNNVEVLIKVLDGCGINGHRWVFVAPVTDLAFNLIVTSPDGEVWRHSNRLGRTADAASDTSAFACSA